MQQKSQIQELSRVAEQCKKEGIEFSFMQFLDLIPFSAIMNIYVIDVQSNNLCYVHLNYLFQCGYSANDALFLEEDFYKKVVFPEDLQLLKKIREAILWFFKDCDEERNEVDYFSCTFRLQRKYSFLTRTLPQMVYQRMKPVWKDNELRYLVCTVQSSAAKKSGNLLMYYKDGLTYKEFNTTTQRWKRKTIELLTERESAILMLFGQGKNVKEIANDLHRGFHTIRNQIAVLFQKLKVNSIQEAIDFTRNHRMMFVSKETKQEHGNLSLETPRKKIRVLLTTDMLQRIQRHLDDGNSIRQAAKLEGIAESAIRYCIGKGKLRGCSSALKINRGALNVIL